MVTSLYNSRLPELLLATGCVDVIIFDLNYLTVSKIVVDNRAKSTLTQISFQI